MIWLVDLLIEFRLIDLQIIISMTSDRRRATVTDPLAVMCDWAGEVHVPAASTPGAACL